MYVKASSAGPRVTFVTTGELSAAKVTTYGGTPPRIVSPQGWQVVTVPVILDVTVNDGGDGLVRHAID
jgi:hypothetical protein